MPTSHHIFITDIINKIIEFDSKSILDIGIGFGKWGYLCREYLEVRCNRYYQKDWEIPIDGIEIFQKYIMPHHNEIYNSVIIGNALNILKEFHENIYYDLIIACDVIEHFNKNEGKELFELIKKKSNHFIITIPLGDDWGIQGASFDNENERHLSTWEFDDFQNCEHELKTIANRRIGLIYK